MLTKTSTGRPTFKRTRKWHQAVPVEHLVHLAEMQRQAEPTLEDFIHLRKWHRAQAQRLGIHQRDVCRECAEIEDFLVKGKIIEENACEVCQEGVTIDPY